MAAELEGDTSDDTDKQTCPVGRTKPFKLPPLNEQIRACMGHISHPPCNKNSQSRVAQKHKGGPCMLPQTLPHAMLKQTNSGVAGKNNCQSVWRKPLGHTKQLRQCSDACTRHTSVQVKTLISQQQSVRQTLMSANEVRHAAQKSGSAQTLQRQ